MYDRNFIKILYHRNTGSVLADRSPMPPTTSLFHGENITGTSLKSPVHSSIANSTPPRRKKHCSNKAKSSEDSSLNFERLVLNIVNPNTVKPAYV